jgi:23S rRNA (adenine-N6)-dimethyltransferase
LSQNFLISKQVVERFVGAAELRPDDLVIEVGAGDGALTPALASRSRQLVAYEIDDRLADRFEARVAKLGNVRVLYTDFLRSKPPAEPFKVVGNIPFSATSAVVDWCLAADTIDSATFITQLEYAKKRTGSYGRWSLRTIQTWPIFNWELRGTIARTDFRPMPRVDAGILHLTRRPEPLIPAELMDRYVRLVELGFSGRGGSLFASLRERYPAKRVAEAFRTASLSRDTVVAFVPPEKWLQTFQLL